MHLNHINSVGILRPLQYIRAKNMMKIRPANSTDASVILKFIRELAEYEEALHCVNASEEDIVSSLFNEDSTAKAIICEVDSCPIGYAVYFSIIPHGWEKMVFISKTCTLRRLSVHQGRGNC